MSTIVQNAFAEIGAHVRFHNQGRGFKIDVTRSRSGEAFQLTYPAVGEVIAEVHDVRAKQRHLVLDVSSEGLPIAGRFLCGHD